MAGAPSQRSTNAQEQGPRIRAALEHARTIAVVGLSDKPERDSHRIARYLQLHGYRIVPVNPMLSSALGEPAFPSISAIPPEIPIDIVDIFRRSEEVPPVVDEAIARKVPTIWMQLGVENPAAAAKARAAGALVLENQCIMVTHRELGISSRTGSR
jgi:predicted CoA-binding protein